MCTQWYYFRVDQISCKCKQLSFDHFRPEKGAAVFWHNIHRSGHSDMHMLHAGCPVLAGIRKEPRVFGRAFPCLDKATCTCCMLAVLSWQVKRKEQRFSGIAFPCLDEAICTCCGLSCFGRYKERSRGFPAAVFYHKIKSISQSP